MHGKRGIDQSIRHNQMMDGHDDFGPRVNVRKS